MKTMGRMLSRKLPLQYSFQQQNTKAVIPSANIFQQFRNSVSQKTEIKQTSKQQNIRLNTKQGREAIYKALDQQLSSEICEDNKLTIDSCIDEQKQKTEQSAIEHHRALTAHRGRTTNLIMKRSFNKQQDCEVNKEPPITLKKYKKTMRILFARRSIMKHRPVIVFSFEGIIGDIYKPNFWSREGTSFFIRPFAMKALKLLYQYFQIVIYTGKPYDKKRIDRVKDWILKIGTPIDGFYVSSRKEQVQIDDFSQIYLDFQQGDQARISQKLLVRKQYQYIGALNIDSEEIQHREGSGLLFSGKSLKTFQESSFLTTQVDLIERTNIPFTLDSSTSQQPLVLLLPNPRSSSNGVFISMLAIAKMIFSLAMVSVRSFDSISLKNLTDNNVFIKKNILHFEIGRKKRIQSAHRVGYIYGNPIRTQRLFSDDLNNNFTLCQSTQNSFILNTSPYTDAENEIETQTAIVEELNDAFFENINWLAGFKTASQNGLFGFKPIQTTDVLEIVRRQKLKIIEVEREREDRRQECQKEEESVSRLSVVMNMVCNILKDSKLSYNPMSSMVNRNVRFFERARLRNKDKIEVVYNFKNDDFEDLDCQLGQTSGLSRFLVYSPLSTSAFKSGSNNMLSKGYELVEQDQCINFNVASWFSNPKPTGKKVHIELPSEKVNGLALF